MTHHFPSLEEVIAIHEALIGEFGGTLGIHDEGALISALMRPQLGYYDGLIQEAPLSWRALPTIIPSSMATSALLSLSRIHFYA